ncbi:HTH-type transcriptional regulator DmlR [Pseudovibrio axinellae]|uniref:HTH-type transcriptional regulator DmlR n=1 Tax=Pseudovibrio axinellae TaxID=989403 RepID=A0A165VQ34_9HYPH|nr:LysR family transcriptional regulator [Pseudovibrio axinellae]KZL15099.1 HTH-type transcriptional regulator DmlR [Pseudovibrio axinellae]SER92725.1 DNA-binding transcriptional regulator, LysR family [Pseudovibrio axinellae]
MDRIDAMNVFTRIVEVRSFTKVAADLGLPRSTVTDAVKGLEARLSVSLLHRTTRVVRPTLDGEAYYRRCLSILSEIEDAEDAFAGTKPKGMLRVDVHGVLARHFLLPTLPDFLERYPDIQIHIGEGDRLVDLVREGVDCALRVGNPIDSDMIGRKLADLDEVTCASPDYLERFGTPSTIDALEGHQMVGFWSTATGAILPLEFVQNGKVQIFKLPTPVTVSGAEAYAQCACLGLGIIQKPRYSAAEDLKAGRLVELLKDTPPTSSRVSIFYPRDRYLSPRVRVFVDWAVKVFMKTSPI